jgi:AcrR family transcriptional regulator
MASTNPAEKPLQPLFPRLPGGPRRMKADEVARHQKDRLEGAIVEAVARHGFAATTVRELVTLAGVSKSTFYDHFQSKEECFLVTFDSVVEQMAEEVAEAYGVSGDERERLVSALSRFMEIVVERPEAASLAIVDSLTLGAAGIAHRERAWEAFEQMARQYFLSTAPQEEVSDLTVRAIVAGVTGVVYQYLRNGKAAELPGLVEPLIDWALSYQGPDTEQVLQSVAAAEQPVAVKIGEEGEEGALGWDEPPDSPLSRSTLSQRERIVRAAAKVVVERGYESLSIPAISAAAGTSNQTFYENFNGKREAFIAAYDIVCEKAFRVAAEAFESGTDGPEAVGTALRALAEYIAEERTYARLAFVEMMAAGPLALDRNEEMMTRVLSFFELEGAKGLGGKVPRVVLEATAAGVWFVVQREIASDRDKALPGTAPELARLALTPFNAAA